MATPHIKAEKGDIAEIVLMPGDPLRAKFIAETYLTDVVMFNQIRNMFGYTGYYNGKRVSVMGSGMGMPSMGIYSYELFKFFDVKQIIRIGSCGALIPNLKLFDIVLVNASFSDSTFAYVQNGTTDKLISANQELVAKIKATADKEEIPVVMGNIYTTDVFTPYADNGPNKGIDNYNCIASEMEAFALFHTARIFDRQAACLLTVSDSQFIKSEVTAMDREKGFVKMVELALKSI